MPWVPGGCHQSEFSSDLCCPAARLHVCWAEFCQLTALALRIRNKCPVYAQVFPGKRKRRCPHHLPRCQLCLWPYAQAFFHQASVYHPSEMIQITACDGGASVSSPLVGTLMFFVDKNTEAFSRTPRSQTITCKTTAHSHWFVSSLPQGIWTLSSSGIVMHGSRPWKLYFTKVSFGFVLNCSHLPVLHKNCAPWPLGLGLGGWYSKEIPSLSLLRTNDLEFSLPSVPFLHCLWHNLKKAVFEISLIEILGQLLFFQGVPQPTFPENFQRWAASFGNRNYTALRWHLR